jgi:hypothetical protein
MMRVILPESYRYFLDNISVLVMVAIKVSECDSSLERIYVSGLKNLFFTGKAEVRRFSKQD